MQESPMASTATPSSSSSPSAGITHVFSSSYLGRLFKNPYPLANVSPFKIRPTRTRADRYILPERPVTGLACANCFDSTTLPEWIQKPADVQHKKARLMDVLGLPSTACKASYNFVKRIADMVYCARLDTLHTYPSVDVAVLGSERVQEAILKNVSRDTDEDEDTMRSVPEIDAPKPTKKQQRRQNRAEILLASERVRARSALHRMRAHVSGWVMKVAAYILFKLLRLILRTVQIPPDQVDVLKKAAEDEIPMIYLPNHRSHLDYILLTFTLAQYGIRAPYVAAGDNLDIPVFSWLLRSLGAFFIKRRLDKDYVYRAVLHTYIEEILKKGESVEFFMEAGRSRTGRPIIPKAGLLSVVIETYLQGGMPNGYIVPVSVSYEKLIEGSFANELMGEPKKKESFLGAVCGIWNVFCTKYGSVRIDFGQPVTVKDYLERIQDSLPPLPNSDAATALSNVFEFCQQQRLTKSMSSRTSILSLCSGIDTNVITNEHRRVIKAMCNHIVYDFSHNTPLMCTQMLAFLLITKYRRGGRLDNVVDDFHWLCQRAISNGRDIGFSGDPRDVVRYAMELLGFDLVSSEISDIDSGVGSDTGYVPVNGSKSESSATETHLWLVKPNVSLPRVLDLCYYAAPVGLVFLHEAVVANALLSTSLHASTSSTNGTKSSATIHSAKIIDRALAITDLLQNEFIFVRPCTSARQQLEQTLERLVQEGILVRRSYSSVSTTPSSAYSVRFCLDKNQVYPTTTSSSISSNGSTTSLAALEDDLASNTSVPEKSCRKQKKNGTQEDAFYLPSEEDELADYEDEVDDENDDDIFSRRFSACSSLSSHRRSSYGIASLVESEDDYNADVIRLYASSLAPLLETYKFTVKMALAELARPNVDAAAAKTHWMSESELIRKLVTAAKEAVQNGGTYQYAEFVNVEPMKNAIKWLVSKGVVVSNRDRVRLNDSYLDDRETLERFNVDLENLCVVVKY